MRKPLVGLAIAFVLLLPLGASAIEFNSSDTSICDTYYSASDTCVINSDKTYGGTDVTVDFDNFIGSGRLITSDSSASDDGLPGGNVDIDVVNNLTIGGVKTTGESGNNAGNGAAAGNVDLNASLIQLDNIYANGGGDGDDGTDAGDGATVTIKATELNANNINTRGGSGGSSAAYHGTGGPITIRAESSINVSSINSRGGTGPYEAPGGRIEVTTDKLTAGSLAVPLQDQLNISADTVTGSPSIGGNSGDLILDVGNLQLTNGDFTVNLGKVDFRGNPSAEITIKRIDLAEDYNLDVNGGPGPVDFYYNTISGLVDNSDFSVQASGSTNIVQNTFRSDYLYNFEGSLSSSGGSVSTPVSMRLRVLDISGQTVWGPKTYNDIQPSGFGVVIGRDQSLVIYPKQDYSIVAEFDLQSTSFSNADVKFGEDLLTDNYIPIKPS